MFYPPHPSSPRTSAQSAFMWVLLSHNGYRNSLRYSRTGASFANLNIPLRVPTEMLYRGVGWSVGLAGY